MKANKKLFLNKGSELVYRNSNGLDNSNSIQQPFLVVSWAKFHSRCSGNR